MAESREDEAMKTWMVAVFYEDMTARSEAVRFCDCFVERFWAGSGIDVSWWSLAQLHAPASAAMVMQKAVNADLIIFALRPEGDLPLEARAWVERWLAERGAHEGTLVGLIASAASPETATAAKHLYLRKVAHRGRMDYLTGMPQDMSRQIPDSYESYSKRADHITTVLDDILHKLPGPHQLV